jgi:hypothetical protein
MTTFSATATIAVLLLLATAPDFGATPTTTKIATRNSATPYQITAQNQFHMKSSKHASKTLERLPSKQPPRGPHGRPNTRVPGQNVPAQTRAMKPRRNQANPPPAGTVGFVSATQIPANGGQPRDVRMGTFGGLTGFITVVFDPVGLVWSYSVVLSNGDGTFATTPALTPVPGNEYGPAFVVGDVDGDGNSDIVQADGPGSITVLLGSANGRFALAAPAGSKGPASPFTVAPANGFTGGTLVMNASSGFLDLWIVDDNEPSNLVQYAGNGDGTFGTTAVGGIVAAGSTAFTAPTTPNVSYGVGFEVIIADLDGDGIVDVAEHDDGSGQLVVYLSSAKYVGAEVSTPDGNYGSCGQGLGSLTGANGLPAIVDTNCNDTIIVYNNTGGVFSEGVYYPAVVTPSTNGDAYPEGVTIADVNGDGNGDVVLSNVDGGDVTVLLGNGDGTLQLTSVGFAVGGHPSAPAIVTDINGDGLPDILVADDEFSLTWMAGYGDGTFQAARDYYAPIPDNGDEAYGFSIANGDFNGDGIPDVVVTPGACCDPSVGITVFLSNPDGTLQPGVTYGAGENLVYAAVGDFNGDGKLDIAASSTGGAVVIFTGTGNGTFIAGPGYSSGGSFAQGIVAAQFNGATAAGFADLAVLNEESSNVGILLNDGSGSFRPPVTYGTTSGGCELATADVNGDTFNDLAIAECDGSQVGVLLGVGDGTFTAAADVPLLGSPYGIALADVNGDKSLDIVATVPLVNDVTGGIAVALNNATQAFSGFTPFAALLSASLQNSALDSPDPHEIQVTDVNGDGFPDLVYVNLEFGTVGVLFGTGAGTASTPYFYDPVEFPTGGSSTGITVADINGDGTPDAVTAPAPDNFFGASVMINGNGSGAKPDYTLTSSKSLINVTDGSTGSVTLTITPRNFYNGTVTFTCSGLPLDMTCAFEPPTLTPDGNAAKTSTLTLTTKAPHGALRMPADTNAYQHRMSLLACLTGMGLLGMLLSGDWKNTRKRLVTILLGIMVLGMVLSLTSCGSSTTPGTPLGEQTISVNATGTAGSNNGNTSVHAVNLTVNVL